MRFLRSNTAVIVTVGPFYDKTDGVTIETALTITNERITLTADTDAGSAPTNILDNIAGATSGTANDLNYITGNDAGMMQMELAAADVNRVGRMFLSITDAANHVPVFHEFFVLPQAIYDWLTGVIVPLPANVTQLLGTAWLTPGTAGTPDVNAKLHGGTSQTGRDIGASVLLSSGTGTGQLDFTSGVVKSSLVQILGNAISGTASQISAAFTKFFDKAAPTGTINSIPDAVAGAAGGLFIAGTNAATSVTTALTANVTGSLSGSVGSVTGLTPATVHADLDDIQARLPAALTANGNMKSSLVEILATALTETAGQISAAFKQFFDVASPTGTMKAITNVVTATNLTNAPTNGDLTATMKTSVTTAATAATPTAAAVSGAVGSVTGLTPATVHADLDDIQARLPAALTANGNMKSSLVEILTTALTETVGQLAGGFKKFFNIAAPASTMDQIAGVTLVNTLTTYTGNTPQTGDSFARIGSAGAGLTALGDARIANLDATVSSRLATAGYTAPPTAAAIADANWDEALGGHLGAGSTGAALNAAGAAGDPWSTAIPGAYGAGTAGYIVGTNLDMPISDVPTASEIQDTTHNEINTALLDGNETTLAATVLQTGYNVSIVKNKTDNLPVDPADESLLEAAITAATSPLATSAALSTVAGFVDTEVAAIKAKTDNLPATPAAMGDAMALTGAAVDAILDEVVEGSYTMRQLLRLFASSLASKLSGAATTTVTIRDISDTKNRIVATVDADGNRSAITLDVS